MDFQSDIFDSIILITIMIMTKKKLPLVLSACIALLCIADSITTLAVINGRVGYEANTIISSFASIPAFHIAKLGITLLILYGIHRLCRRDTDLEVASYITLLVFYVLIVLNNLCVYYLKFGFGFNPVKLLVSFLVISATVFGISYASPHVH